MPEANETSPTMAMECLMSAFRKAHTAYILMGMNPPDEADLLDASEDYQAPPSREDAILYSMATLRQAIHLFTGGTGGA